MATLYCFTPGGKIRKMINDSANPRPPYATRFQREREIVCIIYVLIATNLARARFERWRECKQN